MARKSRSKNVTPAQIEQPLVTMNLETGAETVVDRSEGDEIVSDAVVENVLDLLEANTETPPAPIEETSAIPSATEEAPSAIEPGSANDFDTAVAAVTEVEVDAMLAKTVAAFEERASFETVLDPTNSNIHKALNKARADLTTKTAARVMVVANVNPDILNREVHTGARYNVYAMGKLSDAIKGLSGGVIKNAINNACMKSLFRFRANKAQYTGEMAKASASDKIRLDASVSAMLVRHTVSASTAPTQASSTMQALETLGIVRRSGSSRNPNFDLMATPIVAKLEAVLAA